jgi:methionyl-tRNA synthetase
MDLQQFISFYQENSVLFTVLAIWSLVWKGVALWKAARKDSVAWFIPLLVINLFGVLEILYIFIFSKMSKKDGEKKTTNN